MKNSFKATNIIYYIPIADVRVNCLMSKTKKIEHLFISLQREIDFFLIKNLKINKSSAEHSLIEQKITC